MNSLAFIAVSCGTQMLLCSKRYFSDWL